MYVENNGVKYPLTLVDNGSTFKLIVVGFEYYNRVPFKVGTYNFSQVIGEIKKTNNLPDMEELESLFPIMLSEFENIEEDEIFFTFVK